MADSFQRIALMTWPTALTQEVDLSSLVNWLQEKGFEVAMDKAVAEQMGAPGGLGREKAIADADLIIVVGGDGSMLRTAHLLGENAPPLLGINAGHLGFLADIPGSEAIPALEDILLKGNYLTESRMRLRPSAHKDGIDITLTDVLNDVVLTSGPLARMVEFQISVDGKQVGIFRADGLIIATPTGDEGEATALYLARHLSDLPVEVTRIATGVPMGGELEYVDPSTLGRALEGRTPLS